MAKAQRSYKGWVRSVIYNLREYFLLTQWQIDIVWEKTQDTEGLLATIGTDHTYYKATLFITPLFHEIYKSGDKRKCVETLVHEFSHILTDPLYDLAIRAVTNQTADHLESVREQWTQHIAVVILRNLPKYIYQ